MLGGSESRSGCSERSTGKRRERGCGICKWKLIARLAFLECACSGTDMLVVSEAVFFGGANERRWFPERRTMATRTKELDIDSSQKGHMMADDE